MSLPVVRKCVCGHAVEFHYRVGKYGAPFFDSFANRCADPSCRRSKPVSDGSPAYQLPAVRTWAPM